MIFVYCFLFLMFCVQVGASADGKLVKVEDYQNKLAVWDAEGMHINMDELLAMNRDYGVTIYFFRDERKHNLDLKKLKENGLILIKTMHPHYAPWDNKEILSDREKVREWARSAANQPYIDGLALDVETTTATTHKFTVQVLSEEARKVGKHFHVAPHFSLDRWNESEEYVTVDDYNKYADVVWPWLYNRLRQPTYGEGLLQMVKNWKAAGIKLPIYPIFDWGRPHYGGISAAEASQVPEYLRAHGIETICLFQPHISYRDIEKDTDYRKLWNDLRDNYGRKSAK